MIGTAAAIMVAAGLSFGAQAAPILVVNGSGVLTGVDDVIVDGNTYNVTFIPGSCASNFNGCDDISNFIFTEQGADDALTALAPVFASGDSNPLFPRGNIWRRFEY
jgi:hypothetical protein